jgi:hypothetical protein
MNAEAAATARTVEERTVAGEVEHRQSAARAVGTTALSGRSTTNPVEVKPAPSWPATDERVAASCTAAASASTAAILRGSPLRRASTSWRRR